MYPTTLPNAKVTAEENSAKYQPTGMLDRDQKTLFQIEKPKINSGYFSQLNHTNNNQASSVGQFDHHHNQTTKISARCKNVSQTEDNNETVMCPLTKNIRKFNINRTQTKFPGAFHVIAFIIFLTVNITYSIANPLNNQRIECNYTNFINGTRDNRLMTYYTISMFDSQMGLYFEHLPTKVDHAAYDHYGDNILNNSSIILDNKQLKLIDVITTGIQHIYDLLFNATANLDFFICRHSDKAYEYKTMFFMDFKNNKTINQNVKSFIEEIRKYINLNKAHISELSEYINFDLVKKNKTIEDCLLYNNISVAAEIVTMKKLNGTLRFMNKFFDHILENKNKLC